VIVSDAANVHGLVGALLRRIAAAPPPIADAGICGTFFSVNLVLNIGCVGGRSTKRYCVSGSTLAISCSKFCQANVPQNRLTRGIRP
jgi:hypothetical protein